MITATQSYKQKLLPAEGEDKAAYLHRIERALAVSGIDKKDKAMLLASKAVAVAWNQMDGMQNPYTATPMDEPITAKEILEVSIILMAQKIQGVVPTLNGLQCSKAEMENEMRAQGVKGNHALRADVKASAKMMGARTVLTALSHVNGVFKEVMDAELPSGESNEAQAMRAALRPTYEEFRDIRSALLTAHKGRR